MLWFRVCTIDKTSWKKSCSGYKLRHGKPQKMCTFREWNNEIENQNSKWKTLGYIICATICEQLKCTVFLIQVTDSIAVIVATQFRCVREWMRKLIILGFFFQLKLQPNDKCLLHTHFQFSAPTKIMTRTECWCSNYWNSRPHKHTFSGKMNK